MHAILIYFSKNRYPCNGALTISFKIAGVVWPIKIWSYGQGASRPTLTYSLKYLLTITIIIAMILAGFSCLLCTVSAGSSMCVALIPSSQSNVWYVTFSYDPSTQSLFVKRVRIVFCRFADIVHLLRLNFIGLLGTRQWRIGTQCLICRMLGLGLQVSFRFCLLVTYMEDDADKF